MLAITVTPGTEIGARRCHGFHLGPPGTRPNAFPEIAAAGVATLEFPRVNVDRVLWNITMFHG